MLDEEQMNGRHFDGHVPYRVLNSITGAVYIIIRDKQNLNEKNVSIILISMQYDSSYIVNKKDIKNEMNK